MEVFSMDYLGQLPKAEVATSYTGDENCYKKSAGAV